ncbi:hypothetical protein [Burkholderia pyrrocinia]|uniref:hypothetical protein n=1 Tax=Burkholderia pyrrocinia TaxID=60550 RepID=UPI002AB249F3|nr:hypothetical protein [Burkholderia pyrrocinia]
MAKSLGYDIQHRDRDLKRLIRDMKYFFGNQLLGELGTPIRWEAEAAWPLTLFDGDNSMPQAQLKHILLRTFLLQRHQR